MVASCRMLLIQPHPPNNVYLYIGFCSFFLSLVWFIFLEDIAEEVQYEIHTQHTHLAGFRIYFYVFFCCSRWAKFFVYFIRDSHVLKKIYNNTYVPAHYLWCVSVCVDMDANKRNFVWWLWCCCCFCRLWWWFFRCVRFFFTPTLEWDVFDGFGYYMVAPS
jgi:hypothetical protein